MKITQLCPPLCNPMDYTVHGILQARILEWVAFPFSRGSSQLRDQTQVSRIAGGFFTSWARREAKAGWIKVKYINWDIYSILFMQIQKHVHNMHFLRAHTNEKINVKYAWQNSGMWWGEKEWVNEIRKGPWGISWQSSGWGSACSLPRTWVWSLVGN